MTYKVTLISNGYVQGFTHPVWMHVVIMNTRIPIASHPNDCSGSGRTTCPIMGLKPNLNTHIECKACCSLQVSRTMLHDPVGQLIRQAAHRTPGSLDTPNPLQDPVMPATARGNHLPQV
tara:strand:+ start:211 stop:567 length:357 start_codon:yes stop_codon:yes gene_type:complete